MSLLASFGSTPIHAEAFQLEQQLIDFDPRLQLKYVTREHPQKPGVIGRRYEVWRHCEDGVDRLLGHWRLEQFDVIYHDITVMKAGAEGRIPDAIERIDAHNDERDRQATRDVEDAYGRMAEHRLALERDLHGRSQF